jgi:large subunit ribosomal protein L1
MKKGKKYIKAMELVEKHKAYTKEEAIDLVKKTSTSNFDGSVEIAVRLNVDTKKTDQQVRGALVLPNGTGKAKRVLVLTKNDAQVKASKEAGAEFVGGEELIDKIAKENWLDFDVIIATPEMMPLLGKIGKLLGPRGLMPNPKTGTVTTDVAKAIEDVKKGRIEFRTDSYGNVHAIIGKVSFDANKLVENLQAFVTVIVKSKPQTAKGTYIKNISVSSTMGPGVKVDVSSLTN